MTLLYTSMARSRIVDHLSVDFPSRQCVTRLTHLIQIDLIVDSESGRASSTDILNSADSLTSKKLKKSDTENLLNRLVQDKWLNEVKKKQKKKEIISSL